jgi:hypothetical protein
MRAMSLINLEAIRNAELQTDPFDFMVAPGFLSPDVLARVNADYPAIDTAANHALENLSCGPQFATLMEEMQGEAFASALGEKFDMDLASLPNTVTVRKFCERTDGNIHTDHKSKVITVLVYFNEKWEHDWVAHCWPSVAPITPGMATPSSWASGGWYSLTTWTRVRWRWRRSVSAGLVPTL